VTDAAGTRGALLLLFDVAADAIAEHDHWHTHEHMPERLGIPGFLRGSRWIAAGPGPRYCVLYEVAAPAVLDAPPYRARLDHPSPWTSAMMKRYVGMRRTLCTVGAAAGAGLGTVALVVAFAPQPGRAPELAQWLAADVVPDLAARPGLASCRLLHAALPAPMTAEQAIRGRDGSVDAALFVTGYAEDVVAALATTELAPARFAEHGAAPARHECTLFRLAYALTAADVAGAAATR
jgi:hypothetical protein